MRNHSCFIKNSSRFTLENYSLNPAKNYFQGFYRRSIMKRVAHKDILHHAFQFFQIHTQNLHFPAHKIACSIGRHLHDSKPMISQSFCFHQFSSRGTLNPVSLIYFCDLKDAHSEFIPWTFSFQTAFLWESVAQKLPYFLVTASTLLGDSAVKL